MLQDETVFATAPDQSGRVDACFEALDTAVVRVQLVNASVLVHVVHVDVSVSGRASHERFVRAGKELDAEYIAAVLGVNRVQKSFSERIP